MATNDGQQARAAVLACGLVSSLGYDAATACAAARAGLVRSAPLPYMYRATDAPEGQMAIGHAAGLLTEGFESRARVERLVQGAVEDLVRSIRANAVTAGRCGVFLALPCFGLPASASAEARAAAPARAGALSTARDIWGAAVGAAGFQWRGEVRFGEAGTRTAFGRAAAAAIAELGAGAIDTAIVGAVDSLVDTPVLELLDGAGRLKTEFNSGGLVPGEAAVMFLLALDGDADGRATRRRGTVDWVSSVSAGAEVEQAYEPQTDPDTNDGRSTADLVAGLLERIPAASPAADETPWIVLDLNGETGRSRDWGNALVRLVARDPGFDAHELWHCADAFGDAGAANFALSMAHALRALERGYAPSRHALVVTADDHAGRSGILLSPADATASATAS